MSDVERWLAEVGARCEAATGGTWCELEDGTVNAIFEAAGQDLRIAFGASRSYHDADFVLRARADLPRALRIIARLRPTIDCRLRAPSGVPFCTCRNVNAVRAGMEASCWYCEARAALDYDGRE